ncbi:unnamed protein product, partial [Sphenostylis stenocarpa]
MDGRLTRVDGRLPQRKPLDGRLARVDGRLPSNGSFWTAICLKRTTICSFFA